jgi:hypothetical protein
MNTNKQTGEETMNESYKDKFNATMKQFGIDSLDDLKSDEEKKKFFKAVDKSHKAKNESMTEELSSIAEETINEMMSKEMAEMIKEVMKEMDDMPEMKMLKAETDPTKVEMMKKEMMKEMMKEMAKMSEMSETMKKEMMKEMSKKMNEYGSMNAMKEDLKEYTGGSISKSVSSSQVATALKNVGKGAKLYVQGRPSGKRVMGDVISVSGDTVKIKPTASNGATSINVKDITMMDTLKEADELEEKHVPGHNDSTEMSVGEIYAQAITKMNAMRKTRTTEMMNTSKTDEFDMAPNPEKLTAMIKDPMKSKEEDPKRDLNATYMKSDVRADVKNGGGADMSKVQDAPKMQTAMKKINAMYKTEKYHQTKPGSIHDVVAQMQMNEQKLVSIKVNEFAKMIETYLLKGGVIDTSAVDKEIAESTEGLPLHQELPLNEVREFITTYNNWFSTNHRTEEFVLDEGITLSGKPVKPNQGIPAPKVGKGTGNFTLGGKAVGSMSPPSSVRKNLHQDVSPGAGNSRRGAEPKEPNAFQKFVGKVKKVGGYLKKQITRDYNPLPKGSLLNK